MLPVSTLLAKRKASRGVIAVLMVGLIGMGISASVFSAMETRKASQTTQLTVHEMAQAQLVSYALVPAWKTYLQQLYCGPQQVCQSSTGKYAMPGVGAKFYPQVSADSTDAINKSVVQVVANTFNHGSDADVGASVTLNITSFSAGSSSTIQAVYTLQDASNGTFNITSVRYQ
ncbi:MAG TPA: hypothetical protein VM577_03070 [Anaerovoracaceae bacterium]|nr:hypothetical protein [Anaerovoracaceae bacterium]